MKLFGPQPELTEEETLAKVRTDRKRNILSGILVIVLVLGFAIYQTQVSQSALTFDWGTDAVVIHEPVSGTFTVNYRDITGISLEENWQTGTSLEAGALSNCLIGLWHNDAAGDYYLYSLDRTPAKVILIHTASRPVALALGTASETEERYEWLTQTLTGENK